MTITTPFLAASEAEALATVEAFKNNPLTAMLFDEKLWAEIEQQQKRAPLVSAAHLGS